MDRATNKDGQAIVINTAPDVCLTPMGGQMVPVPYNITCTFDVAVMTSSNVNYGGLPAFTMDSRLPTVKGDEPGVGGGVVSGVNLGFCKPVQHSGTYRVNGAWVIRHGDQMDMNCAGPNGVGNTVGKITYVGMGPVDPHADSDEEPDEEGEVDPDDPALKAAEEEIRKAEEELAAAKREAALLAAETALDVAGIFDPTPASDTAAAGLALNRGDYIGAGLNLLSWIPYVGDAVAKPIKGWKLTRAGASILEKIEKITQRLNKLRESLKALRDKLKRRVTKKNKPEKPKPKEDGGHIPPKYGPGNLPKDPEDLVRAGWKDVTDPRMRANTKSREFLDPATGQKVRFDPGKPGAPGFEGKDHYHVYNPNSTGKGDFYLDKGGNPVPKGSGPSHILP